jgi:hypothetical protein
MERTYVNSLKNIEFRDGNVLFDLGEEVNRNGAVTFEVRNSLILSVKDCGGIGEFLVQSVKRYSERSAPAKVIEDKVVEKLASNSEISNQNDNSKIARIKIS